MDAYAVTSPPSQDAVASLSAGKRKVLPTPKAIAMGLETFAQGSASKRDSPMSLDKGALPVSRKRSAQAPPVEDGPPVSKVARTSQLLVPRRQPLMSSASSRQAGLGPPVFGTPLADPILMRLNALEDTMRCNHEEGMRRLEEIRHLYELQLG